ncbi:leucine-rich repeat-containing protein 26-like [Bufo bufo]|uniref:leucine-rich repeat-containing protein 26-like n=1 Tax=Bufo bufo TaxID=8384 RepID=UPI001ABDA7C1|nr:leucine-rich repeat-containing protein 26-like [Bufo bufo]
MKGFLEVVFWMTFLGTSSLQNSKCPDVCRCSSGVVDCYGRGLYFIPEDLDEDTHTMLLAYNRITALKTLSFYKYPYLSHLELHNNLISNIDPQAFKNLQNLTYLDLSRNQLTILKPKVFEPLTGLKTLNLGNNWITRLPGDILEPLRNLTTLYLHNNALTGLRVDILYHLPSLTHLRLDGNPWVCTCQIQYLLSWMIDNAQKIYEKERTLCGVPKYLNQYPILEIERGWFDHCQDFFTLHEYLYFLLIGLVLFLSSIILCMVTGGLIVFYERLLLKARRKPHVYKKRTVKKRESITNGHHIPVCHI